MNAAKIRKAILAKIAALQADLAALDRLDAEYGGAGSSDAKAAEGMALSFDESKNQSVATLVREAISTFDGKPFNKSDVLAVIKVKHPTVNPNPASVASFLARLGKNQELQVIKEGVGTLPSTYQETIEV